MEHFNSELITFLKLKWLIVDAIFYLIYAYPLVVLQSSKVGYQ